MRTAPALWRRPRFVVGLLLVLGSVLLGAQIFAAADDSVPVWTVRTDVASGQEITAAMLAVRQVRFADAEQADRYLSGDQSLPLPAVATRPLGAGELLPRSALGVAEQLIEVPLQVSEGAVPTTVRVGSVVDVWIVEGGGSDASPVLRAVPVLALHQSDSGFRVVVGLAPQQSDELPSLLGRLGGAAGDKVFLVRRAVS